MLAAHKLYPGSLVIYPGFNEKNSKNFFVSSMAYLFNMIDIKEINKSEIDKLVIVDTKQASRIGELSEIVDKPGVEIHIFDHHPASKKDIKAQFEVNSATGANVTLLTEIIQKKKIPLSPEEATIMCLGIYEDTGSFTFSSTTARDFTAAAFLVSNGADLTTISNLIAKEMDPRQISLLNDMINAAVHHTINGVDVTITSVSCDEYIHDLAFLVQKMIKIESLNALFGIALMKNKIYISARSRSPEVDVGAIATELGGGGHKFAAAATIKEKTLAQTENDLVAILQRHIKSKNLAVNIMSSPAIAAAPEITCENARNLLSRYNVNALLVVKNSNGKKQLLGFISRQVIEKALYHSLDNIPISEYMSTEFAVVGPEADLVEIQQKIIENKQRVLPVIENDDIIGVITRTDLLNILVQESDAKKQQLTMERQVAAHPRTKNITAFMKERLSKRILKLLKHIGEVAEQFDYSAYVVGGFVRDLFLYRHNEDIDIVIEGNGIEFAKRFSKLYGARINAYAKFGTAIIIFADGFKIDVASARMEYYNAPAALPTVEMSSIKMDLFRRDFTVNTLCVALNKSSFGHLIDFFGAQRDLKEKVIRILHNLSFVEDPTRVFRAIRFEQRFGFTIGKLTSGLIENAVKMDFFKRLSGRRVFSELCHILKEENPTPYLIRLNEYNLLKVLDPSFALNQKLIFYFNSAKKVLSWFDLLFTEESYMKWAVYFLILLRHKDQKKSEEICNRMELAPRYQKIFIKERLFAEECLNRLHRNMPNKVSDIYKELKDLKIELLLYIMSITTHQQLIKNISYYVTDLRNVKLSVSGKDIEQLGLPPSPVYGKILSAVMDAKLNGLVKSNKEELDLLKNYVAEF
ncbi:MAG: CBS domain-containing protein [Desulfobacteraceae bacterium]|nr:CBS domain-containing protein [Desulfobacteraceae bacterium]MBC2755320.1 CBS domain-containing protein [Desulfobacteraceae bacterium]